MAKIKYTSVIRKPKSMTDLAHKLMRVQLAFPKSESPLVVDRAAMESVSPYVGKVYDFIDLTKEKYDEEGRKVDETIEEESKQAEVDTNLPAEPSVEETEPSAIPPAEVKLLTERQLRWLDKRDELKSLIRNSKRRRNQICKDIKKLKTQGENLFCYEKSIRSKIRAGDAELNYDADEDEFN